MNSPSGQHAQIGNMPSASRGHLLTICMHLDIISEFSCGMWERYSKQGGVGQL